MAGGSGVAAILGRDSGPTAILRRDSKAMSKMAHSGIVDFLRVQPLMTSCSADLRGPFRESTRAHWSRTFGIDSIITPEIGRDVVVVVVLFG